MNKQMYLMKKHYVLVVILLSIYSIFSFGQTSKTFWFVAPDLTSRHNRFDSWPSCVNPYCDCDGGMPVFLNISAMSLATQVKVSQPANPLFIPIDFNLNPSETRRINLSINSVGYTDCNTENAAGYNSIENYPYDQINDYGILIESDQLITAYYECARTNNPDIWALKGDNALGQDFWVPTQTRYVNDVSNWFSAVPPYNEIHVVATEDNTTVTITPSQDCQKNGGGTLAAGVTFSVVLNRGQTYGLRASSQSAAGHLSGTHITSDKDIAVTQSDDSQSGPGGCADVNGDQIVPVELIGTEYIIMKGQLNWGEYAFILATQDGTEIYTNGNAVPIATIDQGETHQLLLAQAHIYVETSKPAYIYHEGGFGCEVGGALLPSIFCTGSVEVYFTRSLPNGFFLNLMVPQGGEDDFWIEYDDGSTFHIDPDWFEPVLGTAPDVWMALKPTVNGGAWFDPLIPASEVVKVYNTSEYFHLGTINGGTSTGCNYGYFSDFGSIDAGAEIASVGGEYLKACYGDSVQLIAQGGLTYEWTRVGGGSDYLTANDIPNPIAIPPSGYYDYDVRITGDCDLDSTWRVTIKMAEYMNANFHTTDPIICYPDSIRIIDESVGVDLKYLWDFGDSQTDTTSKSQFYHAYDSLDYDSVYTIYLLLKDNYDCIDTIRKDIIVYPAINADFEVDTTMGCHPLSVTFTNTSTGNLNVYEWEFGDLSSSSDSLPPPHLFNNYGDTTTLFNVMMIATSPFLCKDTVEETIAVYPYLNANFVMDQNVFCTPDSVELVNGSTGGIDSTYWNFGASGMSSPLNNPKTDSIFNVIYTNTGLTTIYDSIILAVTNYMGCVDSLQRSVVVYPQIDAEFTPEDTSGCSPFTIAFTDGSNALAAADNHYNWDFGDGGSASVHSPTHTFYNNGTTDTTFMVVLLTTSDDNCTDADTSYITVHPYLKSNFTVNNADSCADYTVKITNTSLGDTESYAWDFGDGGTDDTSNDTLSHKYINNTSSTIYNNLSLITSNSEGCIDTFIRVISVYPGMHTTISSDVIEGCNPLDVDFYETRLTSANYTTSIWDFGNGISYNGTTATHQFNNTSSANKTYTVTRVITSTEGCIDRDTIDITVYAFIEAEFRVDTSSGCTPLEVEHIFAGSGDVNSIEWDFGGIGSSTDIADTIVSFIYPNDSTTATNIDYTISLTVENSKGCADNIERHIIVYPRPTVAFDLTEVPSVNCQPLLLNLSNNSDDVASNYYWDFGDTTSATRTTKTIETHLFRNLSSSSINYTVTLTGTSQFYCRNTAQNTYAVDPFIKGDFSITQGAAACSPDTVILANASKGDFSYATWIYGDGFTEDETGNTVSHPYPPNQTGSIVTYYPKMVAFNSTGCPDTSQSRSITVYPEVKAEFFHGEGIGCHPFTDTLINQSITSTSPVVYSYWDLGFAGLTSTQTDPIVTYLNESRDTDVTYTIELTVQSSHYCEDKISKDITIFYKPYASINISEGTSCSPFVADFTNNSITGYVSTYTIDFGDGSAPKSFTSANDVPSKSFRNTTNDIETYSIALTVKSDHFCTDTDTTKITIYPEIEATFVPSEYSGCHKLLVDFIATSSVNAQYFAWDFGDGESATLDSTTHSFKNYSSSDQVFEVELIASSSFDCHDDTTIDITVYPQPQAGFEVGPSTRQRYPDTTFIYTNNSNSGDWLFEWSFESGDPFVSKSRDQFNHSYPEWRGGTYYITMVATNKDHPECNSTATHTVYVDPPLPVAMFSIDFVKSTSDSACVPVNITFTDNSLYTDNEDNNWVFGDGEPDLLQGSLLAQRTHTYDVAGTYTVELEVSGPGGTDRMWKTVTTYPLPIPEFQVNPSIVELPNAEVSTKNFTENGDRYIWDFDIDNKYPDDTDISNEFEPSYKYIKEKPGGGTYVIKLIAISKENCQDSTDTSVEDYRILVSGSDSLIMPNAFTPNGDGLNDIFIPDYRRIREYHIQIYNRWGEKVYDAKGDNSNTDDLGWNGYIYNISDKNESLEERSHKGPAPQGVYVYKLVGKYEDGVDFKHTGDITLIR